MKTPAGVEACLYTGRKRAVVKQDFRLVYDSGYLHHAGHKFVILTEGFLNAFIIAQAVFRDEGAPEESRWVAHGHIEKQEATDLVSCYRVRKYRACFAKRLQVAAGQGYFRVTFEEVVLRLQSMRQGNIIGIHLGDVMRLGLVLPPVIDKGATLIDGTSQHSDPRVSGFVAPRYSQTVIR